MSLRTTLLSCLTAIACVAMILAYVHKYLRYQIIGNDKAVFVLDRQTTLMHHCNKQNCQLITPQGTNIEQMRQLAGIPTAQQVMQQQKKQQIEKCRCEAEPKDNLFPQVKLNVSSFQSLEPQMMSPKALQQRQKNMAQQINMPVMMQQQKPQQPFPSSDMSPQVIKTGGAPKQQQNQNNTSSLDGSSDGGYGGGMNQSASTGLSGDSSDGGYGGGMNQVNSTGLSGDSSDGGYGDGMNQVNSTGPSGDSSDGGYGGGMNQGASTDPSGGDVPQIPEMPSADSISSDSSNSSYSGDAETQTTSAPGIPEIPEMPSST